MMLYSGLATILIDRISVATVNVHLEGDPEGEWSGSVRAAAGEAEPPEQLDADEWVMRLNDGREFAVTPAGYVMHIGEGLGITSWHTGVDGLGPFPLAN